MRQNDSKSGNATIILLIIALVVGIASTVLIITISRTNPQTQSSAAAPVTTLLPKSTDSGQTKFTAPITTIPTTTTTTPAETTLPAGTVTTKTSLSADKTMLAVDFIAANFASFTNITYTITYTVDVSAVATTKNIQGTFAPAGVLVTGYQPNGYPYIRKIFTLGTCSGSACTYDSNPRSFTVTVATN